MLIKIRYPNVIMAIISFGKHGELLMIWEEDGKKYFFG